MNNGTASSINKIFIFQRLTINNNQINDLQR